MTDADCRAFLLGRMDSAETERFETRLLEDGDLFEAVRSAEDDLLDAFARGQLNAADRASFLQRFGGEPRRLAFAQALAQRTAARAPQAQRRAPFWVPLAAAAALVLAAGAGWWLRARPAPAAAPAAVATHAPAPVAPSAAPVVALLTLSTTRAAGEPPVIAVPPGAPAIELRVRLHPADRYDAYTMELRSAADALVWRGDNLHADVQNGDLIVSGRVLPAALTDGVYELAVRGGGTDLGYLSVRIMHTP